MKTKTGYWKINKFTYLFDNSCLKFAEGNSHLCKKNLKKVETRENIYGYGLLLIGKRVYQGYKFT